MIPAILNPYRQLVRLVFILWVSHLSFLPFPLDAFSSGWQNGRGGGESSCFCPSTFVQMTAKQISTLKANSRKINLAGTKWLHERDISKFSSCIQGGQEDCNPLLWGQGRVLLHLHNFACHPETRGRFWEWKAWILKPRRSKERQSRRGGYPELFAHTSPWKVLSIAWDNV